MHRRTFLRASGTALGGLAVFGTAAGSAFGRAAVPQRLGVQLYTVRELFRRDFIGVLEAVKRMGYDEVEFAGYQDRDPQVVRAILDDVGLTAPAVHVGLEPLAASVDGFIEIAHTLGHRYLVVPWIEDFMRRDLNGWRRIADRLNAIGARTREAGITLAYHNHDFEFRPMEGSTGYDVLLAQTDPELVKMELDLYWAISGGRDPLTLFQEHPGRFKLVHVKDRTANGHMADVGSGVVDWHTVLDAAEAAGVEHAFVEHDDPDDPLASIRRSHDHLAALRGS